MATRTTTSLRVHQIAARRRSDAALFWMARLLAAGDDPRFIARRLIISAAKTSGTPIPAP